MVLIGLICLLGLEILIIVVLIAALFLNKNIYCIILFIELYIFLG
jgi:hypothetical protein